MGEVPNPHDRFFRERMAEGAIARDFLREYLPRELVPHLDLETLAVVDARFPGSRQGDLLADAVYRVDFAPGGGPDGPLYVIAEHKSFPDDRVAWQLLQYATSLCEREMGRGEARPLPRILPLVVYHGPRVWRPPEGRPGQPSLPDIAKRRLLYLEPWLVDVSASSEMPIRGGPLLRTVLLSLRYVFAADLVDRLPDVLAPLAALPDGRERSMAVAATLGYLESAAGDRVTPEISERAVGIVFPREKEELMATHHAVWLEKGRAAGREEGREEGRTEGALLTARQSVLDVVEARFGERPDSICRAVESVDDLETLKRILRRAVTVGSLDDFRGELDRIRG